MKIPFDIKFRPQIESGEYKVETRDGKPVRIICWDRKPLSFPISALVVIGKDSEESHCYSAQGIDKFYQVYRGCDLIITTPEPELTEFEQALETFLMNADASEQTFHEDVKKYATELLELARKELVKEGTSKNEMGTILYDAGFEDGKEDALKDLPRWSKAAGHSFVGKSIMYDEHGFYSADITKPGCRYITCDILAKLPGFND